MDAMWKVTIREMLDAGMTPEEVRRSLGERYPEHPQLMDLVEQITASTKAFCKKAQMDAGFGYNNSGQSNFSVPNSEGEVGSGNPVDNTGDNTPSSSYTDHAVARNRLRKQEEEERERRRKRKQLMKELKEAQMRPGDLLKKRKPPMAPGMQPPVQPGQSFSKPWEQVRKDIMNMGDEAESVAEDMEEDFTDTTDIMQDDVADTTDDIEELGDTMTETMDEGSQRTEELGEAAKKTTTTVDKLIKSLESLFR